MRRGRNCDQDKSSTFPLTIVSNVARDYNTMTRLWFRGGAEVTATIGNAHSQTTAKLILTNDWI